MSNFYQNLERLEKILDQFLAITPTIDQGVIEVNGHRVNTNLQLPMMTPTDCPAGYLQLLQKIGIMPADEAEIPTFRDIPLRVKSAHPTYQAQQHLCADYMKTTILANQWSMLFPREFEELKAAIKNVYRDIQSGKLAPTKKVRVTHTPDGVELASGGYWTSQHVVSGMSLWLREPENDSEAALEQASTITLLDKINQENIVNALTPSLAAKNRLFFIVRGLSATVESPEEITTLASTSGGHVHFFMADKHSKTIYAINDTRYRDESARLSLEDDSNALKEQIDLFLHSIGDKTIYKFKYVAGKSRQPDDASYLAQPCSVSQLFHKSALSSGVGVDELKDTIPGKVSTLIYVLQYAAYFNDTALLDELAGLIKRITQTLENEAIETPLTAAARLPKPTLPLVETMQPPKTNYSFLINYLATTACIAGVAMVVLGILAPLTPLTPLIAVGAALAGVGVLALLANSIFNRSPKKTRAEEAIAPPQTLSTT